jgi:acyl-CoA synthetase (AMP-forming)/AMP-acid ligase II
MNHLVRQPWRLAQRYHESGAWTSDTIPGIIRQQAINVPAQIAVVDADRRVTYASLGAAVERTAALLASHGIDRGDAVIVREPDSAAFVAASAAAHAVEAVSVPIAARAGELEVARIVERVRPRAYAGTAENWPCLSGLLHLDLSDAAVWKAGAEPVTGYHPDPDALMEVMFTSGTTGRPKGVMNSANTKLAGLRGFRLAIDVRPDDVFGVIAPMHHNAGWGYSCLLGLMAGSTVVCVGRGDPVRMLDVLSKEGVTTTFLVPTHAADLLAATRKDLGRWDLELRHVMLGGSLVPARLIAAVASEWRAQPIVMYGTTETQCESLTRPGDALDILTGTVGRTCPGVELALLDPETGRIIEGDREVGEIVTAGPTVCLGYYDDQPATDLAFTKDGWLRNGDLGEWDHGNLRIVGRIKDVILRGGGNIIPSDVENALDECEGVAEVAVCGLPDERLGELICACIVGTATLEDVQAFLRVKGVGRGLWPDVVVQLDHFPRTAVGKIQRNELAKLAAELR